MINHFIYPFFHLETFRGKGRKPAYYIISLEKNITNYPVLNIFPISFGILDSEIVSQVPPKSKVLGRVIPGNMSTYFTLDEEALYYKDLQQSLFALTYKKGGWDCLRHYEILASGTLPLFLDIAECPLHALRLHPRKLYSLILQFPGLLKDNVRRVDRMTYQFDRIDIPTFPATASSSHFDTALYVHITKALLQYIKSVLSTKALAKYVTRTMFEYSEGVMKNPTPKSILYLSHQDHDMDKGDYLTDFLLLGFYEWFGYESGKVIDFPRRDCLYKDFAHFTTEQYKASRKKLYGAGFVFGHRIDVYSESKSINRDGKLLRKKLENHEFDIVILGSGHRDGWASTLHLWETVCLFYDRREVAMIFGADYPLSKRVLHQYAPCAAHIFAREGYEHAKDLVYNSSHSSKKHSDENTNTLHSTLHPNHHHHNIGNNKGNHFRGVDRLHTRPINAVPDSLG